MKRQHLLFVVAALLLTACGTSTPYTVNYFGFKEKEDGRWGLMNLKGEVLCENEFKNEPSVVANDRFYMETKDGKYEFYEASETPQPIKDGAKYLQVGIFSGKYAPVLKSDGTIKYIDKDGNVAIDLAKKYPNKNIEIAYSFYNDRALIKMDGKYGAIDLDGKLVVPCKYSSAGNFFNDKTFFFEESEDQENQKWYIIDKDGKVLKTKSTATLSPKYLFENGLTIAATDDNKHVIIDENCNIVRRLGDRRAYSKIMNDKFIFEEDGNYGLMNTSGEVLISAKYDNLQFNGAIIVGEIDDEWYLLDENGKKISEELEGWPILLYELVNGYDSFFYIRNDGKYQLYDSEGNEVALNIDIKELGLNGRDYVEAAFGLPEEEELEEIIEPEYEDVDSTVVYEEAIDSVVY